MNNFEQIEKPIKQADMLAILGITRTTIIKLRKEGKVPYLRVGARFLYIPSKVLEALTVSINK